MARGGKVIVAMSGGVDSSVAAHLLKEQGYDCVGVFMRVGHAAAEPESCASGSPSTDESPARRLKHGCCSASDAIDARAVARRLGIPFYALNFEKDFERIVDYFVDEYARARTPNPCVRCNIDLKFGKLLRYADMMDAEFIATGHYARIVRSAAGARLARAANAAKDQSYVLCGIRREDLPRCLFPLGEFSDKSQVRRLAAQLGLRVHDKPDSQEICFVPDQDYKRIVRERRPESFVAGDFLDSDGHVIAQHEGIGAYTIGQRRGLGFAAGKPVYVTRLDVLNNQVTLGSREDLLSAGLIAENVNWLTDPPDVGVEVKAATKIRHMHTAVTSRIRRREDARVFVEFDEPQVAVTPGQAAVFYDDTGGVLGGGWIDRALDDQNA